MSADLSPITTPTTGSLRAIGLMSGTSADGIDAALVTVTRSPRTVTLHHYLEVSHSPEIRQLILDAAADRIGSQGVCRLHGELGEAFAAAALALCAEAGVSPNTVDVIGSHGQTVWHGPDFSPPATLQIGDAARIAQGTGCAVVSDFRAADMAVGGQGAPLTPMLHRALFAHATEHRAVVNIGGIANLTWLPAGGTQKEVLALDSGPGNMVIDALVRHFSGGSRQMDVDGAWAAQGQVDADWLDDLLSDPYFAKQGPKSTGRERFGEAYAAQVVVDAKRRGVSPQDTLATVTALTAHSIAGALLPMGRPARLLLCGGGAHNATLVTMLGDALSGVVVERTDAHHMPGAALEAVAFAELACRHRWQEPGNLPTVTGAAAPVVLGVLTPKPI